MKILQQIDIRTRIVIKSFHLPAMASVIMLQRRIRGRWRNRAWMPHVNLRDRSNHSVFVSLLDSEKSKGTGAQHVCAELNCAHYDR